MRQQGVVHPQTRRQKAAHRLESKTPTPRETHHLASESGQLVSGSPPEDEKVFLCNEHQALPRAKVRLGNKRQLPPSEASLTGD
jgi:hypothetical protein